jgi:hypothetical protein
VLSIALNAAVDAADETGKKSAVLVTDWHSARWYGLAKEALNRNLTKNPPRAAVSCDVT